MSQATISELYHFLIYMLGGLSLGLIYDTYRIIRWVVRPGRLVTYIEDTILVVIGFAIFVYLIFWLNSGEIRLYGIFAIILGTLLYFGIISRYYIRLLRITVSIVKKILTILVIKPWRYLSKVVMKIFKKRQK
jgi:spore cortex biosynthesis protein YabQ